MSLFVSAGLAVAFFVFAGFAGLPLALHIAGTLLLGVGIPAVVFVSVGRSSAKVVLDSQQLQGTWKAGPLRFTRAMPIPDIRQVVLTRTPEVEPPNRRRRKRTIQDVTCVVVSTTKRVPVTSAHSLATSRELAGLIRGRLRKMGCEV